MIVPPKFNSGDIYNKIIEKVNEHTNEIFYEFVLEPNSELFLIFYYDSIVPSNPTKDTSLISENLIKI